MDHPNYMTPHGIERMRRELLWLDSEERPRIVAEVSVPVYLAGGLTADNVDEAVRTVRPFGLDLCSGVRTEDRLDGTKLSGFFSAVSESG